MPSTKQDILRELQRDILLLQGFRPPAAGAVDVGLGPICSAFPHGTFPTGAIHEFICSGAERTAASGAFVSGILGPLMRDGGACIWIRSEGRLFAGRLFPPALAAFGIGPERVIFIDLKREKEILWCMEEALKCEGLAAVVGETPDIGFTASRRLQLAVEQSRVTAFLLRTNPRDLNTIARVARWKVTSLASQPLDGLPGIGFPRWKVELTWVKNGLPAAWVVEWRAGRFHFPQSTAISDALIVGKALVGSETATPAESQRRRAG
jgi:protein ImuA